MVHFNSSMPSLLIWQHLLYKAFQIPENCKKKYRQVHHVVHECIITVPKRSSGWHQSVWHFIIKLIAVSDPPASFLSGCTDSQALWLSWRSQTSFHSAMFNDQTSITVFKGLINPLLFPHQSREHIYSPNTMGTSTCLIGAECWHVGRHLHNAEAPGAAENMKALRAVGCRKDVLFKSRVCTPKPNNFDKGVLLCYCREWCTTGLKKMP